MTFIKRVDINCKLDKNNAFMLPFIKVYLLYKCNHSEILHKEILINCKY